MQMKNDNKLFAGRVFALLAEQLKEYSHSGTWRANSAYHSMKQLAYATKEYNFLTGNMRFWKMYGAAYSTDSDKRLRAWLDYVWTWVRDNLRQVIRLSLRQQVSACPSRAACFDLKLGFAVLADMFSEAADAAGPVISSDMLKDFNGKYTVHKFEADVQEEMKQVDPSEDNEE